MKTLNLNQISLRNHLINRRMHGFSFRVSEDEIEVQDVISPLSFNQIPISSTPWMLKCIKNTMKSDCHSNWCLDRSIFSKIQGQFFLSWRLVFKGTDLGVAVRWRGASRSTIAMKRPLIESSWLSPIRLINDQGFRCVHMDYVKRCVACDHPLDLNPMIVMCQWVHRSHAISVVIIREMNG